jgi:O-antigen/teichoic acid export membrane protein
MTQDRTGPMPPVLGRLMRGTFFLALKTPLQALIALVSIPLVQRYIGPTLNGAYVFAWGFGFFQFLLEFGMSSALQREVADTWTRGDRAGVRRAIACGMDFYAAMSFVQAAALLGVAYFVLPETPFRGQAADLIFRLLWLQALTTPFYGLSAVVSSVLQAARRYDLFPRLELVVVVLRFGLMALGYAAQLDFFGVVVAQTILQIVLLLGPGLWVMVRELGYNPRFARVGWSDFAPLLRLSGSMFLIQLSVVLADKLDALILGFALPVPDPGPSITVYQNVSKPFLQIRQTAWMLAYLVMPAVASLVAAGDDKGLERIKYDGSRFLVGLLLPVTLLAWIYAAPFLEFWVGPRFVPDAPLLRLFLVATLPLVLSILAQMAMGVGKIDVIAVSALSGALLNLPSSWFLTRRIGVAGVIWGTVATTLVSNGLVPGVFLFRLLKVDPRTFLTRTLSAPLAGAAALIAATWTFALVLPAAPSPGSVSARFIPFFAHLAVGTLAYLIGYAATPNGRDDLGRLVAKLLRRAEA